MIYSVDFIYCVALRRKDGSSLSKYFSVDSANSTALEFFCIFVLMLGLFRGERAYLVAVLGVFPVIGETGLVSNWASVEFDLSNFGFMQS